MGRGRGRGRGERRRRRVGATGGRLHGVLVVGPVFHVIGPVVLQGGERIGIDGRDRL